MTDTVHQTLRWRGDASDEARTQNAATVKALNRMIKAGRREYVQVLRLLETFEFADLHVAVKTALRMGAVGFDAIKHLVLCHVERRPPRLDLDVYPYLPRADVGTTSAASYMALLSGDAASAGPR